MISKQKYTSVYVSILRTLYTCYMFRPLMWQSSGRCMTKDIYIYIYIYIEILQKFLNQRTHIKYEILKIMYSLKHIMKVKIQIKTVVIDSNG